MMLPIILAIEPDGRQAARVAALAPAHISAEIVVVGSVGAALDVLETRRPDLVLTPPLFSSRDDATLTARLRELEGDRVELPILVTPLLASGDERDVDDQGGGGGLLKRLKKPKQKAVPVASNGCSPELFAAQITEYLVRLVAERHDREQARRKDEWMDARGSASAPMLGELLTVPAHEPLTAFAAFDRDEPAAWEPKAMEALEPVAEESVILEPLAKERVSWEPVAAEPARFNSFDAVVDDAVVPTIPVAEEGTATIEPFPRRAFSFESFESRPEFPPLPQHSNELIDEPVLLAPVATEISVDPLPAEIVERVAPHETVEMLAGDLIEVVGSEDPTPRTDDAAVPAEDEVAAIEVTSDELVDDLESVLADQELEAEFSEAEPESVAFEPVYPSISEQLAALEPPVYTPAFVSREFVPAAVAPDAVDAGVIVEPEASDAAPADELWGQIQGAQPAIAPIEGPELKKRRPPTPPKTPKASRAKATTAVPAKPAKASRAKKPTKPMQDEWGLYDPEQCGFAALLERLDDLTESESADKKEDGRSAIMRR